MEKAQAGKIDNIRDIKIAFIICVVGSFFATGSIIYDIAGVSILYILWQMIAKRKKLSPKELKFGWVLFIISLLFFGFLNYIRSTA